MARKTLENSIRGPRKINQMISIIVDRVHVPACSVNFSNSEVTCRLTGLKSGLAICFSRFFILILMVDHLNNEAFI